MTEREYQLVVQLAGCSAAAFGATHKPAKKGGYGWSPAYQQILGLHRRFDKLTKEAASKR